MLLENEERKRERGKEGREGEGKRERGGKETSLKALFHFSKYGMVANSFLIMSLKKFKKKNKIKIKKKMKKNEKKNSVNCRISIYK